MQFRDRRHAGSLLADRLRAYAQRPDVVVLALLPGVVVVGRAVADSLGLHLDALVCSTVSLPERDDLAIGAVVANGATHEPAADVAQLPDETLASVVASERERVARREVEVRSHSGDLELRGLHVILVDDGLTSPACLAGAADAISSLGAARLIAALPVAPVEAVRVLDDVADEVVMATTMGPLDQVGAFYADLSRPTDDELRALLAPT
jgi:putative phosphoribosyl transferase